MMHMHADIISIQLIAENSYATVALSFWAMELTQLSEQVAPAHEHSLPYTEIEGSYFHLRPANVCHMLVNTKPATITMHTLPALR